MTSDTIRKRAERLRRKEAGEVRVECWLNASAWMALSQMQHQSGCNTTEVINEAVTALANLTGVRMK